MFQPYEITFTYLAGLANSLGYLDTFSLPYPKTLLLVEIVDVPFYLGLAKPEDAHHIKKKARPAAKELFVVLGSISRLSLGFYLMA